MSVHVPIVALNNGVSMPILGFGVFQVPAEETEQGGGCRPRYRGLRHPA